MYFSWSILMVTSSLSKFHLILNSVIIIAYFNLKALLTLVELNESLFAIVVWGNSSINTANLRFSFSLDKTVAKAEEKDQTEDLADHTKALTVSGQ